LNYFLESTTQLFKKKKWQGIKLDNFQGQKAYAQRLTCFFCSRLFPIQLKKKKKKHTCLYSLEEEKDKERRKR
jgi:hypothetical protein